MLQENFKIYRISSNSKSKIHCPGLHLLLLIEGEFKLPLCEA